jgi:hypothetical protein
VEAFVTANRAFLQRTRLLEGLATAAGRIKDQYIGGWVAEAARQMQLVLAGHPEQLDMVSSRLLWLCVALDNHVEDGQLRHADVDRWLLRPATRRRITPRAVRYLARDYYRSRDQLQSPRTGYVLIIAECALHSGDPESMNMVAALLRNLPPPSDVEAWRGVQGRLRTRLLALDRWYAEDEQSFQEGAKRVSAPIPPDDF